MVAVREPTHSLEPRTFPIPQPVNPVAGQFVSATESECPESDRGYGALFDSALSFQKKGEYQKAIVHYTKAIKLNPQLSDAYINRGAAYESIGDLDLALQDVTMALHLYPKPEAYNNRANIHFEQGAFDLAIEDYSKSTELDPKNTSAYIFLGHAFKNLASYDHAIREYNKALALDRDSANIYVSIGIVYSLKGDHDHAMKYYDEALRRDFSDPHIYLNRGASYEAKGDYDSAERDFSKALALDPDYADAYGARSAVFIRRGECDRALQDLDKALQLNPHHAYLQAIRGSLHLEKGDLDNAIQDFDRSLAMDPNNSNAHNDRGVAYERKGDPFQAMQDYNEALRIRPDKLAYVNRGISLLRLAQWDKARSDLLSARNMGLDLESVFRGARGGVSAFEEEHNLKLPQDIADMVDSDEASRPAFTEDSILELFRDVRESVPDSTYSGLPSDGAQNYRHYLYGRPKE